MKKTITAAALLALTTALLISPALAVPVADGLVFHVDAADPLDNGGLALPADGSPLDAWVNKGTLGATANAISSGSARPVWFNTGGPNSQPRVNFDGLNDVMTAGSAADWKFLNYDDPGSTFGGSTIFAVYQTTSGNPEALLPLLSTGGTSSATEGFDLFYDDRSAREDQLRMIISKGVSGNSNIDTPGENGTLTPATWGLITTTYEFQAPGDDAQIYVDGLVLESQETMNAPLVDQDPTNPLHIGKISTANLFNAGDFAEILIYDRRLTANELERVGEFLETKYGLATEFEAVPIPEPNSLVLLSLGVVALIRKRRRYV